MCGIFGVVDMEGVGREDITHFRTILEGLTHRGPDARSLDTTRRALFGHALLSIVGDGERQPLFNELRTIILVCNGEIFNHVSLRNHLEERGHRFSTHSDCEVILHLYETYGEALFDHIEGFYSFALWDEEEGRLLLARDHAGRKPLFYHVENNRILFSSDIRSIVRYTGKRFEVNTRLIKEYLAMGFFPSPHTVYRSIFKLRPSQFLLRTKGGMWSRNHSIHVGRLMSPPSAKEFYSVLKDATRKRLSSEWGNGVLLSGGLDSTCILHCSCQPGKPPSAYSVNVEHDSEQRFQHMAAHSCDARSYEVDFKKKEILDIPHFVHRLTEPVGNPVFLPLLKLAQEAQKNIRILLTGDGADELFAGYDHYHGVFQGSMTGLSTLRRNHMRHHMRYYDPLFPDGRGLRYEMFMDFMFFLGDYIMPVVDSASMAYSLETRHPFLDKEVISLSHALGTDELICNDQGKHVIREAFRDTLPEAIIRRGKQGFNIPLENAYGLIPDEFVNTFSHEIGMRESKLKQLKRRVVDPTYHYRLGVLIHWLHSVHRG